MSSPSLIGDFRPVRFSTGIEKRAAMNNVCIEYGGKKYFVGKMARRSLSQERRWGLSGLRMFDSMGVMRLVKWVILY